MRPNPSGESPDHRRSLAQRKRRWASLSRRTILTSRSNTPPAGRPAHAREPAPRKDLRSRRSSRPLLPATQVGDHRGQRHQRFEAQWPPSRLRATVGRLLRNPDRPPRSALAHIQPTRALTANEQHLQKLSAQRMERMRDHQRTQTAAGRLRNMPCPSTTAQRTAGAARSTGSRQRGRTSRSCTPGPRIIAQSGRDLLLDRAAQGAATQQLRRPRRPRTDTIGVGPPLRADRPTVPMEVTRPDLHKVLERLNQPTAQLQLAADQESSTHFGRRPLS